MVTCNGVKLSFPILPLVKWEWPGDLVSLYMRVNRADYLNMQVLTFQLLFLLLISCHYATGMCIVMYKPVWFLQGSYLGTRLVKVTHHSMYSVIAVTLDLLG